MPFRQCEAHGFTIGARLPLVDKAAFYDAAPSLHYLFKTNRAVMSGRPDPWVRFVSYGSRHCIGGRVND